MADDSLDTRDSLEEGYSGLVAGDPSPANGDGDTLLVHADIPRSRVSNRPGFIRSLLIRIPGIGPWFIPSSSTDGDRSESVVINEAEQQASFKSCAIVAFIGIGGLAALFIYLYNSDSDSDWNKS